MTAEWTKKLPAADGFYWLQRKGQKATIVKVYDISEGLVNCGATVSFIGNDHPHSLIDFARNCLWSGPLQAPMQTNESKNGT